MVSNIIDSNDLLINAMNDLNIIDMNDIYEYKRTLIIGPIGCVIESTQVVKTYEKLYEC